MNIAALISHVPNPRANRRMAQLAESGQVTLFYWNKGGESCTVQDIPGVEQREFYLQASRTNTLKRMIPMLSYVRQSLQWLKEIKPDVLYAERFDMVFIIWLYKLISRQNIKMIFEIPDLPHMMMDKNITVKEKIVAKVIRVLENVIYKQVDVLIVTSEKFYEDYYSRWINRDKVIFMPNSPDLTAFNNYKHDGHEKFTVGFIGVVRYPEQLKMLMEASKEADVNVLFAGFTEGYPEIKEMADKLPNVTYHGRYNYDKEIASLYGACDAIYSVYDSKIYNVNLALPNKLYEAVYCGLPIIVAKGTYLAEVVEKYSIGVAINDKDTNELVDVLLKLKTNKRFYENIQNNCKKANYVLNETATVIKTLNDLLAKHGEA